MNRIVAAVVCAGLLVACSGDGDDLAEPEVTADPSTPERSATTRPITSSSPTEPSTTDPPVTSPPSTQPPTTRPPTTQSPTTQPPATQPPASVVEVPDTGVPGLDSADEFCSAWSRFGGTWQVLLVGSSFLGDPRRVAEWEVASSRLVNRAYDDLIANFPPSLASEAGAVAEGFFGVLDRRAEVARSAAENAGIDTDAFARLEAAWLDALARWDPDADVPDLDFTVPDDLGERVATAVADFQAQRVAFNLDPSMVVAVDTPLTDDYLDVDCPDQGTLAGGEIGGG